MARSESRPLYAIVLMLGATLAFVCMQAVVKVARRDGMDPTEVMFYRTAPGLPVLWWILRRRGKGLRPDQPRSLFVRSLFGSVAMSTNFTSMRWLTLAQFSTLSLMQPVFVALAAPLILRERVRPLTWAALSLACAGSFTMLAPALDTRAIPLLAAGLGLTSALASAFAHIWVRKATETDPAERVVFHFAAWVSVGALIVGVTRGSFRGVPDAMSGLEMGLCVLGMSSLGTIGQILMTRAHVFGEAATVSLVGYSNVVLSIALDLVLFGVVPVASALSGALLMVIAGIVLVRGEREPASRSGVGDSTS
jgi:drug/metabolite transporter (DMT)-like permease